MNKLVKLFWVGFCIFMLQSCEGYAKSDGTVVDRSTNLPLDSVSVEVVSASMLTYTDSTGKFDVRNNMGSCFPKCDDIVVRFSKIGYQTITLTNPKKEVIVWMEK